MRFSLASGAICHSDDPPAVYREVVTQGTGAAVEQEVRKARDEWIRVAPVQDSGFLQRTMMQQRLHAGESEAITLARDLRANHLLMDEQRAVLYARTLGFNVVRTPMIYVAAKRRGAAFEIRDKLDSLRQRGFWLKTEHYEQILKLAST